MKDIRRGRKAKSVMAAPWADLAGKQLAPVLAGSGSKGCATFRRTGKPHSEAGTEIAEAAIVLPVLFLILFEMVWLSLAYSSSSTVTRAASAGAMAAARATCAECGNTSDTPTQVYDVVNQALQAGNLDSKNIVTTTPTDLCTPPTGPTCRTHKNVEVCTGVPLSCGTSLCQTPPVNCGTNPTLGVRVSFGYQFNSPVPIGSWQSITIPASAQAASEN